MKVTGIVIHHSACPSINGRGYDFFVTKSGVVVPSFAPTEPGRIHLCVEGDYAGSRGAEIPDAEEQWFVAAKWIDGLCRTHGLAASDLVPHSPSCPGSRFPWSKLVISIPDGYH